MQVTSLERIDGDVVSIPDSIGMIAIDRSRHSLVSTTSALSNVSGNPFAQMFRIVRAPGASVIGSTASTLTVGNCGAKSIFVNVCGNAP